LKEELKDEQQGRAHNIINGGQNTKLVEPKSFWL
jgi:hypothetical protein